MTTESTISVEALRKALDEGQPVTVLDVRPTDDWVEWAIPGSIHVDAYHALQYNDPNALAGVDLPGDRPVVTVCFVGATSLTAAAQLRAQGLEAVSLAGGMKAWSLAWNKAEVPLPGGAARVIQVRRTGKGCLSYVIGSNGRAAVVDPALEPDIYLDLAGDNGWTIDHILETHVHADHLSRARRLAEASGAALHLPRPAQDRVDYPFSAIRDGESLEVGKARLEAMLTPGHTPESACFKLDDRALFTGDTLFLETVGRPDLKSNREETEARARALYRSLQRLLGLPPDILVLPGHTSQPIAFDGAAVAGTLAGVRERVELLSAPEETFVEWILGHIPATPPNYERIVELNAAGITPSGDPTELEAGANRCAIG
jgi:glyoxylase-like metal-dependent hydrolase (beta-lactamase superfamily II)